MKESKFKNIMFNFRLLIIFLFSLLLQAEVMSSEVSDEQTEQITMTDDALKSKIQNYLDMIEDYNDGIFCIAYDPKRLIDGAQQAALSLLVDTGLFDEKITLSEYGRLVYRYYLSIEAEKYKRKWDDLEGICFGKARVVKILDKTKGKLSTDYKITYQVAYEDIPDLESLKLSFKSYVSSEALEDKQSIRMTVDNKKSYVNDDKYIRNWFLEISQ